jgi:hypothetical protein
LAHNVPQSEKRDYAVQSAPVLMTRDQILIEIDRVTQLRIGLSGQDTLCAYRAGTLEDPGRVGDALVLADLLDIDDPIYT